MVCLTGLGCWVTGFGTKISMRGGSHRQVTLVSTDTCGRDRGRAQLAVVSLGDTRLPSRKPCRPLEACLVLVGRLTLILHTSQWMQATLGEGQDFGLCRGDGLLKWWCLCVCISSIYQIPTIATNWPDQSCEPGTQLLEL